MKLLTPNQAASLTGHSANTIRNYIRENKLPATVIYDPVQKRDVVQIKEEDVLTVFSIKETKIVISEEEKIRQLEQQLAYQTNRVTQLEQELQQDRKPYRDFIPAYDEPLQNRGSFERRCNLINKVLNAIDLNFPDLNHSHIDTQYDYQTIMLILHRLATYYLNYYQHMGNWYMSPNFHFLNINDADCALHITMMNNSNLPDYIKDMYFKPIKQA